MGKSMKKAMKKSMKKVMKKTTTMKRRKAMKASIVAKGKRGKSSVFRGTKVRTSGGLKKQDLTRNKQGKVVSKKASENAKKVFENISDGGRVTRNERWTLRYCLAAFKWDEAAHDWIVSECSKLENTDPPAKRSKGGKSYYQQIDGVRCDRSIVDACDKGISEESGTPGRVTLEDAMKVWTEAADGNKVTECERWTLRLALSKFTFAREAHDYIVDQLAKVDKKGRIVQEAPVEAAAAE